MLTKSIDNIQFKKKYLKYKIKYLQLRNNIPIKKGGNDNINDPDDTDDPDEFQIKSNLNFTDDNESESESESESDEYDRFNTNEIVNIQTVLDNLQFNPDENIQQPLICYYLMSTDNKKIFEYTNKFYDIETNEQLLQDEINIFEILYEYKEILLIPNSKPFFKYYNLTDKSFDDAIDSGGLTKNVFYLLSKYFGKTKSNLYFTQDSDTKLYTLKAFTKKPSKEEIDKIYFIGQLFGLAIKLSQLIEIELDLFLLYQMANDDFYWSNTKKIKSIINDYDSTLLNSNYPYACYNSNIAQSKPSCNFTINNEGEYIEIDLANIPNETTKKIIETNKSNKDQIDNFVRGFRSQIDIEITKLNRLPLKQFNELIYGIKTNNYDLLIEHLEFNNFSDIKQINSIKKLISDNIKIDPDYIDKLLLVITGTTKIPSIGYPKDNRLRIEISDGVKIPYEVHTCFNQMLINKNIFNKYYCVEKKEETELFAGLTSEFLTNISNDWNIH